MWNSDLSVQAVATEETYLGKFLNGTSSAFSGSSEYNAIYIALGVAAVVIILNLTILFWLKDDYFIRHGKKMSTSQSVLYIFAGLIAVLFYLSQRPQGKIVTCLHCGKSKLEQSPTCFYCGREAAGYIHKLHTHPSRHAASPAPALDRQIPPIRPTRHADDTNRPKIAYNGRRYF
jgi:hypothetical protein